MQFFVKKGGDSTPKEMFIIEMQGDLESRNKEHLEGKFIGDLHYTKDGTINNVIDVDTRNIYKNQSDIELPLDDTEYTSSDVKIVLKKSTVALK